MIQEKEVDTALRVLQVFLEKRDYLLTEQDSTTVRQELKAGHSSTKVYATNSSEIDFVTLRVQENQLRFVVYNRQGRFDNLLSTELNRDLQIARSFYGKYLLHFNILEWRIVLYLIGNFFTYQIIDKLYLPTIFNRDLEEVDYLIITLLLMLIILVWWRITLDLVMQVLHRLNQEKNAGAVMVVLPVLLILGALSIHFGLLINNSWKGLMLVLMVAGTLLCVVEWISHPERFLPPSDSKEE